MTKRNLQEIIQYLRNKKINGSNFKETNQYLLNTITFSPDINTPLKKVEAISGDFALFVCANGKAEIRPSFQDGSVSISWLSGTIKSLDLPWRIHNDCLPLGLLANGLHRNISLPHAPHIMVAGSTGSGKSYWMHNAIQTSISHDDDVFGLDPKWSEFARYSKYSNFLHVKESFQINGILDYLLELMDFRYEDMYKQNMENAGQSGALPVSEKRTLLYIDELNDLVMTLGEEFLFKLLRLAQKGRAANIHIVCATQAPTAKLLSGELKANFPVKIAFKTASAVASRVVLGVNGAEALSGAGDGLCVSERGELLRFRGYLVKDQAEIDKQDILRQSFVEKIRSRIKAVL